MDDINEKVKYVLSATYHDGSHHCHWPRCPKAVPPAMWGCREHWYKLPKHLRDLIWATYRPGQEISKTPSRAYVLVAKKVQEWILANAVDGTQPLFLEPK